MGLGFFKIDLVGVCVFSLDWESGDTLRMGVSVWAWKVTVPRATLLSALHCDPARGCGEFRAITAALL